MKKTLTVLAAAGTALVLTAVAAVAHAPTVAITSPTDGQLIEVASFPTNVAVAGTVSHTNNTNNGQHNLCAINEFAVSATDGVDTWSLGSKTWSWANNVDNCPATDSWSYNFAVPGPGVYTLTAKGKHTNDWGEDEIDFEVDYTLVVSYPAAPSVAAKVLADSCQSARWGSGKTGGNFISEVAGLMGKGATFPDSEGVFIAKSSTGAYKAAVADYLTRRGVNVTPGANCS